MQTQSLVRKTTGVILAVTLLIIAYLGSYLPMRKSTAFIRGMRAVEAISANGKLTPELFENIMTASLLAPSPIGQEELVRQATGMVMDLVQRGIDEPERMVNFAESFYTPIVERGRGMSFSQDLYVLGLVHQAALMGTRDGRHLAAAIAYFEEGLRLSPDRPQFLYGLFDAYRLAGDFDRARETGEKIISLWPADVRVTRILGELP
jgi:tetratricopeptide (TPR) repeat protein